MTTAKAGSPAPRSRWKPTFEMISVDGVLLRVAQVGEGPALLLINGIGANIEMWQPLASSLPGRRLVMFDFPGTGASPPMRGYGRMPVLARLLARLLEELEIERADVLGYSWGGVLAQQLAHQFPDRVRTLILSATTPGLGGQPPAPWVIGAMATPLRYYSKTYLRLIAPIIYGTAIGPDETHTSARRNQPPTIRGYTHQLCAIYGWSSRWWLASIAAPTLVLAGEKDHLAPIRNSRILAKGIRDSELQSLPGGHLFLLQDPGAAARAIESFLSRREAG